MNSVHPGESVPLWSAVHMPEFPEVMENLNTEVCVIGGGMAGLTTAYLLCKEGKKVCLLEDFELGSGQSGRTTAHFVTALDDRYSILERVHGHKGARLAAQSHRAAIDKVIQIAKEENILCDLEIQDGYLFALGDERIDILQTEFAATHRAGITDTELVDKAPIESFDTGLALRFPNQMKLHPMKYMVGLANAIVANGGQIFTNTKVNFLVGGKYATVTTENGFAISCDSIVVATNTPINDRFAIHTKQAPYRTYVMSFRIPKGTVPHIMLWDTLDPYHYVRVETDQTDNFETLIVGGEDHKTGQELKPEEHYTRLETWARAKFPMIIDVTARWSGQVMEPVDGLAFLGRNPMDAKNVYMISGDSGNGMTHTTIGAMLITDQIIGRVNPWEQLYSPSRVSFLSAPEFVKENANVIAQYKDWFTPRPQPDFDEMAPGEGTVFRKGMKMIAVYKDNAENLEFYSAACPHLAGIVSWNKAEKSWDCPCHGSRFDCNGKVIEGPASTDLKKLDYMKIIEDDRERKINRGI